MMTTSSGNENRKSRERIKAMDLRNERPSYLQSKLLKFDSNPRVGKQQWQLIMP